MRGLTLPVGAHGLVCCIALVVRVGHGGHRRYDFAQIMADVGETGATHVLNLRPDLYVRRLHVCVCAYACGMAAVCAECGIPASG